MAISSYEFNFVKNSYFTDETEALSIDWTGLGGFPATDIMPSMPDTLYLGMSSVKPTYFNEAGMEVPFVEVNPYDENGYYYATYTWDITPYQANIRSMLMAYRTSPIYVYSKGIKDDREYINWHLCYVSIADADAVPIFTTEPSYKVTDSLSTGLTGNTSTIIRYVSDTTVSFACEARKESLLKNATVKIGSKTSSVAYSDVTSASSSVTMSDIDGEVFNVTLLDSRGFRTMHSVPVERYIEYFYPTCSLTVTNPSASGGTTTLTADGLCFNGSFGSSANTITVQYRYKTTSGTYNAWKSMTVTRDGSKYTATASVSGLNYQTKYSFQARITDKITTVSSIESIAKSQPVFDWGENDFRFNVPVNIGGALDVDGAITAGNVSGQTITATNGLTIEGTVTINGVPLSIGDYSYESGNWYPRCNACSTPDTKYGSYLRIGDTVVVSFYFDGYTDTFLENSYLYFSNLPYVPSEATTWKSGGGTCSGYSTASSLERFEGWCIQNNVIYGRTSQSLTSKSQTIDGTTYRFYVDTSGAGYILTGLTGQRIIASGTIAYQTSI